MKLKKYEEVCSWCNGTGFNNITSIPLTGQWYCRLCSGKGIIDWVDRIKLGIKLNERRKL